MRVGINVFEVMFGEGSGPGAGIYVIELLRRLIGLSQDIDYLLFVNSSAYEAGWFPKAANCQQVVVPFDARKKWIRPIWEQFLMPFAAYKYKLDVIHSPFNTCPMLNWKGRTVVTVTDLAYFYYREAHPDESDIKSAYYTFMQPLMFKAADQIISISHFTRDSLIKQLKIDPGKITAIPLGSGQFEQDGRAMAQKDSTSGNAQNNDRNIILTIASGMLHKNLIRMIEAFAKASLPSSVRLVIAGEIPRLSRKRMITQGDLIRRINELGLGKRVTVSGYLSRQELCNLYDHSLAFIYPSLYEGFGLPILEAMRWGVPVICSNSASVPEVGGDAVMYFDPRDTADMARSIEAVVRNPQQREEMVKRGFQRLNEFSWDRVASQTLEVYRKGLSQ